MKKRSVFVGSFLAASFICASIMSCAAADLTPGVTVTADENSITGYTVTFVYENAEAESVDLRGAFTFFYDEEDVRGNTPETFYKPEEWANGMFEAGDESLVIPMEKAEGTDLWTVSFPLPCGHYQYVYLLNGDTENKYGDPANPQEASGVENGMFYDRSTFYVPYDAEKQSESIDFSFMAPREDDQTGTLEYVNYTDVNGNPAPLGVYLPYGYDPDGEPYKLLLLSHGAGGNECDWFAGGSADYIYDNLVADGTAEPAVIVTMNNTIYSWDMEVIVKNVVENILPFVEENYNVSTEVADRAFMGLSAGGMTATNVLFRAPEAFGYVGILSGGAATYDMTTVDIDAVKNVKIFLGAGIYDFGYIMTWRDPDTFSLSALAPVLDSYEIAYQGIETVYGSHDWNTWPLLLKIAAEDFLWK